MNKKTIISAVVTIIVVALVVWYFATEVKVEPKSQNTTSTPATSETASTSQSLGAQIYSQSNNPIPTNLPATNPVQNTNPIQGLYTNPF